MERFQVSRAEARGTDRAQAGDPTAQWGARGSRMICRLTLCSRRYAPDNIAALSEITFFMGCRALAALL